MQLCSICHSQVNDLETICPNCKSDLREFSQNFANLNLLKANPRVNRIRFVVAEDACPACQGYEGSYDKDKVPLIPINGCSHPLGCRCTYKPVLDEIYP